MANKLEGRQKLVIAYIIFAVIIFLSILTYERIRATEYNKQKEPSYDHLKQIEKQKE